MRRLKTKLKYKWLVIMVLGWLLMYKYVLKNDLIEIIERSLPGREGVLLMGMVLGEKGKMSREFYKQLVESGLIHIVVISGSNLMMLGRTLIEFLAKIMGRLWAIIYGGGVLIWYVNLVGWEIPIIRALIFLSIFYWAQILGRQFNVWRALLLVGIMMLIADFEMVKESSFWLSIMAFLAVVLNKNAGIIKTTVWVSLFILPIISMKFGRISWLSPLANLSVLFLVEIITVIGFIGTILASKTILMLSYPLLRYLIEVVEGIGKIGTSLEFRFNWLMFLGWYLIIGAYWYGKNKGK